MRSAERLARRSMLTQSFACRSILRRARYVLVLACDEMWKGRSRFRDTAEIRGRRLDPVAEMRLESSLEYGWIGESFTSRLLTYH